MTELYDLYEKLSEIESLMYSLQSNDDIDWDRVRVSAAISAMNGLLASERCKYWDDNLYIEQSVKYADKLINELRKEK